MILGPAGNTTFAHVAHPPIDSILLKNVAKVVGPKSPYGLIRATTRWTTLSKEKYYELIAELKAFHGPDKPFWMLERHFTVTHDTGE